MNINLRKTDYFEKWFKYFSLSFMVIFGSCLGIYAFLYFSEIFLNTSFVNILTGGSSVLVNGNETFNLSHRELDVVKILLENGYLLTQDQLLSRIAEYYNTMINIMIVIVSLVITLSYFSIKSLSKAHAEEIVEKQVDKSVKFALADKDKIEQIFYSLDAFKDLADISESREKMNNNFQLRLDSLESRLIGIEYILMKLNDQTEEV